MTMTEIKVFLAAFKIALKFILSTHYKAKKNNSKRMVCLFLGCWHFEVESRRKWRVNLVMTYMNFQQLCFVSYILIRIMHLHSYREDVD